MSRLTLHLPDTLHNQLKTQAQQEGISLNQYIVYALTRQSTLTGITQTVPDEFPMTELTMLAAVKLFELGQLSSGQAAQLAGVSRVEFLYALGNYQVSPFIISAEQLKQDVTNAQSHLCSQK